MRKPAVIVLALVASTLVAPTSAHAGELIDTEPLRDAVTAQGIRQHLDQFQDIGTEFGNRSSAFVGAGYDASAEYVRDQLKAAGYKVRLQPFDFLAFEEKAPATLARVGTSATAYDVTTLLYSGSGSVEGPVVAAANAGCAAADFVTASVAASQIALVAQGGCDLDAKVGNAVAAGYDALILVSAEGTVPTTFQVGQLTTSAAVPVVGVTHAAGADLRAGGDTATVRVTTDTVAELRPTSNVIATSRFGKRSEMLVVGAHLDSVTAGPGINDNGSGSATILEIARQITNLEIETKRRIRFAFWAAEEFGLIGSRFYVNSLSVEQRDKIHANLNFDMLGSTNYVRFVYDGDGSTGGPVGPPGSAEIEAIFVDFFDSQGLASDPTPFNGRSDYGPFIAVGIPAGGLFSGAEGIKTPEQEEEYGGTAGTKYDPCYHLACDTIANVKNSALNEMSDAAAHTVLTVADPE